MRMNLIAEKYSDDRCCFSFWVVIFLDKEVKCSDLYTHECLGASDAALVSFLFCHLATCISRFAAALCSFVCPLSAFALFPFHFQTACQHVGITHLLVSRNLPCVVTEWVQTSEKKVS